MCGLVGFAGKHTRDIKTVMRDLLLVDSVRGMHSTGVCTVFGEGLDDIVKVVGGAVDLFDSNKYQTAIGRSNSIVMGHNRWATRGKVNKTNAHPFEFPSIVGMHNGTLTNQGLLPDSKLFEVDSENIFYAIDKDGFSETVKKIQGAYALVWWDRDQNTLNFSRNDERTLYYCFSQDTTQMFWASEMWMLSGVLGRNKIEHTKIKPFKEDVHYIFDIDMDYNSGSISKPKTRAAVAHKPKALPSRVNWGHGFNSKKAGRQSVRFTVDFAYEGEGNQASYIIGLVEGAKEDFVKVFSKKGDVLWELLTKNRDCVFTGESNYTLPSGVKVLRQETIKKAFNVVGSEIEGPNGKTITKKEFDRLVNRGCAWCSEDDVDPDDVVWVGGEDFLCGSCSDLEEVTQYVTVQ